MNRVQYRAIKPTHPSDLKLTPDQARFFAGNPSGLAERGLPPRERHEEIDGALVMAIILAAAAV